MRGQLCDEEGRGVIEVATRVSSMITLDLKERFVLLIEIQMEMGNSNLIFRFRFKLIFDIFILTFRM